MPPSALSSATISDATLRKSSGRFASNRASDIRIPRPTFEKRSSPFARASARNAWSSRLVFDRAGRADAGFPDDLTADAARIVSDRSFASLAVLTTNDHVRARSVGINLGALFEHDPVARNAGSNDGLTRLTSIHGSSRVRSSRGGSRPGRLCTPRDWGRNEDVRTGRRDRRGTEASGNVD